MEKASKKNIANKCQIFTPVNYVKELLDSVGYCENIVDKTIFLDLKLTKNNLKSVSIT